LQLPIARDLPKAKALLAEAGWAPGNGGILQKDGKPFKFTALVPSNRPELAPIAAALQSQLREAGIDMQVKVGPTTAIPQAHRDCGLQAAFLARPTAP
jgi:peptide/nickel transport system substrate-binding protein